MNLVQTRGNIIDFIHYLRAIRGEAGYLSPAKQQARPQPEQPPNRHF